MIVIPQHGSNNELFDVSQFLADIDLFAKPDAWHVSVGECVGDHGLEIEALTASGRSLSDGEFRSLYSGIHQTIDGHFVGLRDGSRLFELRAVDSTFWESLAHRRLRLICEPSTENGQAVAEALCGR